MVDLFASLNEIFFAVQTKEHGTLEDQLIMQGVSQRERETKDLEKKKTGETNLAEMRIFVSFGYRNGNGLISLSVDMRKKK